MPPSRWALAILLAIGACGDNSPTAPDAAPNPPDAGPFGAVTLAQLPDALQQAVCGFEVRCGLMPDLTTCQAAFDPATTDVAQLAALVASGDLTYDADKAGDCLTSYRDASCEWVANAIGPAPVCDEVFVGDKPPGVDCHVDEECTGRGFCEVQACASGCCAGVCRWPADPVQIGEDCTSAPCADGAYCRLDGAGAATCAAVATAGGVCTAVDGCERGSVCDLDPASGQGTCVRLASAGAHCDPDVAVGSCAGIDQYCDRASSTCTARKASGACQGDAECTEAASCVQGSCQTRPGPGDACGIGATGGDCLGDLECVSGTCTVPTAEAVCP